MVEHWFISDHHLRHWNIIKYCDRPFKTVEEMGEALLTYHNELVKPSDHVSFLGDVTMLRSNRDKEWLIQEIKKYNGHKRLFLGNHDHFSIKTYAECFEKVYATWRNDHGLLFSHIPIHPRSLGSAKANVHGHIHNNPDYDPVVRDDGKVIPYINICVEAVNYRPVNLDELLVRVRMINGK